MDRSLTGRGLSVLACLLLAVLPARASARGIAAPYSVFVPVLTYHHVKPLKPTDNAIERGLTVLPTEFDAQLRYLRSARYTVITARQLVDHLVSHSPFPARSVVLSFDDGYADVFDNVYKPLLRMHWHATFFIVPSFLDTPRYLTWKQVETMAAHGMDIEAHTMTHPDLTAISAAHVWWQLTECRRELQQRLHRQVRVFAYPYGAYSPIVVADLRKAGYLAGFTTHPGWVQTSTTLLTAPRVYVDLDDSVGIFAGRLHAEPKILADDPA